MSRSLLQGRNLAIFYARIEFDFINPRTVVVVESFSGVFFEFGIGTNDENRAFRGFPDGHGGRPEAVARKIPVGGLFNVFGEPAVFKVGWEPVDVFVLFEK